MPNQRVINTSLLTCCLVMFFSTVELTAQPNWERAAGGRMLDNAHKVITSQLFEFGPVQIGGTKSYGQANVSSPPNVYISAFTPDGVLQQDWVFEAQSWDVDYSITNVSNASTGDFVWTTGVLNSVSGSYDIVVVRYSIFTGIVWTTALGGLAADGSTSVIELSESDGGDFVIAGVTESFGVGARDGVLARLDRDNGSIVWANTYGGAQNDELYAVKQATFTEDNNSLYAVGYSNSFVESGNDDAWLLNVDVNTGAVIFTNTYGGDLNERAYNLLLQQDEEFGTVVTFVGETFTYADQLNNAYVVRSDENGNQIWQFAYDLWGANGWDVAYDLTESLQYGASNMVVVGQSNNDVNAPRGEGFALEIDSRGNVNSASRVYGGGDYETLRSIVQQNPEAGLEGYYIVGQTQSYGLGAGDQYILSADVLLATGFDTAGNECAPEVDVDIREGEQFQEVRVELTEIKRIDYELSDPQEGGNFVEICNSEGFGMIDTPESDKPRNVEDALERRSVDVNTTLTAVPQPNPVKIGMPLALQFTDSNGSNLNITVSDIMGRILERRELPAGTRHVNFDTSNWPVGSYTVTVSEGLETHTSRIVLHD